MLVYCGLCREIGETRLGDKRGLHLNFSLPVDVRFLCEVTCRVTSQEKSYCSFTFNFR